MPKAAIARKIQEMREQPEHVRIRYVLIGVTISMTFVVVLWIFVIQDNVRKLIDADNPLPNSPLLMQEDQQSLQDILQTSQDVPTLLDRQARPAVNNNAVQFDALDDAPLVQNNTVDNITPPPAVDVQE